MLKAVFGGFTMEDLAAAGGAGTEAGTAAFLDAVAQGEEVRKESHTLIYRAARASMPGASLKAVCKAVLDARSGGLTNAELEDLGVDTAEGVARFLSAAEAGNDARGKGTTALLESAQLLAAAAASAGALGDHGALRERLMGLVGAAKRLSAGPIQAALRHEEKGHGRRAWSEVAAQEVVHGEQRGQLPPTATAVEVLQLEQRQLADRLRLLETLRADYDKKK